jgi:crotonobetainyl-CoA:carnitine CoA-transferase CaiB-like acyl-CoA transferase
MTTADVFVSSVRAQSLRRLDLDYDKLREINPRLIYCNVCGFSEDGPYAGRPAFDDIIQAMSGLAVLQGHNNPEGPQYINTILVDKIAGLAAASAVGMALFERERSGLGQAIEVPMFELMVSFTLVEHMASATFFSEEQRTGYSRVLSPDRRPYRTSDGYISVLPYTTAQWCRFVQIAGRPDYAEDPAFRDPARRSRDIHKWYHMIAEVVMQRSTAEWVELLSAADIPVTPVRSVDDVLHDEHLEALGFFHRDTHPSEGDVRTIGIPIKFSRTPGSVRRLAPQLDQHREEILREERISRTTSASADVSPATDDRSVP